MHDRRRLIFSLLVLFSRRAYYLRAWLRLVYTVLKSMPHVPVVQKLDSAIHRELDARSIVARGYGISALSTG